MKDGCCIIPLVTRKTVVECEATKRQKLFSIAKSCLAGSWDATVYWRCNSNIILGQEPVLRSLWEAVGKASRQPGSLSRMSTKRQVVEMFFNEERVRDLRQERQVLQTSTVCPKKQ